MLKWRHFLGWCFGALVVAAMVYAFREAFLRALEALSCADLGAWISITFVLRLVIAHGFVLSLRHAGGSVSLLESFMLGWVRSLFNQVVPLSGSAVNVIYMNRVLRLDWTQISSLGTPLFIMVLQATLLVAAAALAGATPLFGWLAIPAALITLIAAVVVGRLGMEHFVGAIGRWLPITQHRFRLDPTAITVFAGNIKFTLLMLYCLAAVLRFIRLLVLFRALDFEVSAAAIFFISAMAELSSIVQLTPGGLGLRELLIVIVGMAVSGRVEELATVALVERALTMGLVAIIGSAAILALRTRSQ